MMKKILLMFLIAFLLASPVYADTHAASSCSLADVRTKVAEASIGDTVWIPPGACNWNDTLVITTAITLQGAGAGTNDTCAPTTETCITSTFEANGKTNQDPFVKYTAGSEDYDTLFRLTGILFDCDSFTPVFLLFGGKGAVNNRVDHNRIINTNRTTGNYGHAINVFSGASLLVDNNYIQGNIGMIMGRWSSAWSDTTWNGWDVGTQYNLFIEDNTLVENTGTQVAVVYQGGSVVLRYNDISYTDYAGTYLYAFDTHGHQSGSYFASFGGEMYGNRITANSTATVAITEHRGGIGRYFYNRLENTTVGQVRLWQSYGDLYGITTPSLTTCPAGTLYAGQKACAPDGRTQHPQHVYLWNNRYGTAGTDGTLLKVYNAYGDNTTYPLPSVTGALHLRENTEWWKPYANWTLSEPNAYVDWFTYSSEATFNGTAGVGCGTLASRPATCTEGVGYWATTQSCSSVPTASYGKDPVTPLSGTLYICGPTGWADGSEYTPYTYPHPLRGESSPDVTAPAISNGSPSGALDCTSDPRNVLLSLSCNDDIACTACKVDEADIDIDLMATSLTQAGSNWSTTLTGKACDATYTYYAKCEDAADNESAATTITWTINEETVVPPPAGFVKGITAGVGTIAGGGAGGFGWSDIYTPPACNPATNEIGDRTTYGSTWWHLADYGSCVLYNADCSGTLGYAFAQHNSTASDNAKMCVYADDNDSIPDAGDTRVGDCVALTSSAVEWSQSAAKVTGSVTSGKNYWVCLVADTTQWPKTYTSTGTRTYRSKSAFTYASPPATLDGTWGAAYTEDDHSYYVQIE